MNQKIFEEIQQLKKEKKAVILAHNYQIDEVQQIADITGDSLELSRAASKTDAEVIIFAGVHFMAENAAILNPDKVVLLPDLEAGCPLADMITAEKLREMKKEYPQAAVVCYVNSSAEVKAEATICCTSSNAVKVVNSLPERQIIFAPDKNLGHYVSSFTDKEIILWKGFCPIHARLTREEVVMAMNEHPQAVFVAHPECVPEVLALADYVCSTSGMFKYARETAVKEIIIGTESGMLWRLRKENPEKRFFVASTKMVCPNMKKINLEKIRDSLEEMKYQIIVPEEIRKPAYEAVRKMLEIK
ncbi:MAG TPA: quinolinate synthase [Elusimicrobia bacterium]|jgi:quinolinate synthase|nr:quinolinate synthase [Elusimicrobiota bacterium]